MVGVYTSSNPLQGTLVHNLHKYRDTNGSCIAIFLKSVVVRGRRDSPKKRRSGRGGSAGDRVSTLWNVTHYSVFANTSLINSK